MGADPTPSDERLGGRGPWKFRSQTTGVSEKHWHRSLPRSRHVFGAGHVLPVSRVFGRTHICPNITVDCTDDLFGDPERALVRSPLGVEWPPALLAAVGP